MAEEIRMPKVAMAMNEGTVTEWLKAEGEAVAKDEILLSIETEKTAYEVEATAGGLLHIVVTAGDTVPVDTVIALMAADEAELASLADSAPAPSSPPTAEAGPAAPPAPVPAAPTAAPAATTSGAAGGRIKASPLAKRMAEQEGIDLALVKGTGPDGRIKKRDILAFEEAGGMTAVSAPSTDRPLTERDRIPLDSMRRAIIANVMHANTHQCMSTGSFEGSAEKLLAARKTFVEREEQLGTRISLLAFFVKALAHAARAQPIINARMEGDEIVVYDNVNVAVAVATPSDNPYMAGLRMPVVRNAEAKGIVQIDADLRRLIAKARDGSLSPAEMADATVSLSSTSGLVPGTHTVSSPILNSGQSFMLQPGNILDRPAVIDGKLVPAKILGVSYTFDHVIMDGLLAGQAITVIKDAIEHPELMLG